jgi:tRNA(Ile2)-agmatinylcytidine synthase
MKSIGKHQGYRCSCGKKVGEDKAEFKTVKRDLKTGWYEPPVGSRRHLSKPLKRN